MTRLLTLSDAVAAHARLTPDKIGARDSRRALSFRAWDDRATRLASGLRGLGLVRGDRVGVLAHNCIEWLEIYVALARAGLVAVPVNFRLTAAEIGYILVHAEVAALITGADLHATADTLRADLALPDTRWVLLADGGATGWTRYEDLIDSACGDFPLEPVGADDICALMYTSGTTGRPKGAIRKHGGSSLMALATALEFGFTRDDTGLLVMPLCHANSLYFATTFIHLGATCVVDDRRSFDPEALLATLAGQRVTFTSLVPTHYIMLLALPAETKARYDVSSVGKLLVSSAPVRRDTKLEILKYFPNVKLYELYGSTEHGWVTLLRPHEQLAKLGSVGREWVGSGAVRILDDLRREVPDGEVGELFSRTPYVFDGYWKNPEKTAEAFEGDWCSVGDLARRDADGFIWLVDRKNNMIISGGENVYPSEVEAVVGAHPAVKDVAVIGVPHDKWGEAAQAVVVLHAGQRASEADIRAWCRTRLAGFKCPSHVVFVTDADMPRTATGKVLHRVLRQRLMADAVPTVASAPSAA